MTGTFLDKIFGNKQKRDLKILLPLVSAINEKESWALGISTEDFPHYTRQWKEALKGKSQEEDTLIPEIFALVREAARRVLGERMYDVQLMGALVLHLGAIAEMKTGEGKTLACVPATYLNVLMGKNVHIVTVNDYLAQRDAEWMGKVFQHLDISVGVVQAAMDPTARREAYRKDIIYATNNELGFDYLRDNMCYRLEDKVQCGHSFCVVDEVDSILIDEARTPLIISGSMEAGTKKYYEADRIIGKLQECKKDPTTGEYPEEPEGDYKLDEKSKRVSFTNEGMQKLEQLLQSQRSITGSLFADENFEYLHYATQAVRAHHLYHRDKQYVINERKVEIVDEFTGRVMHGRRYSDGLHQAIEVKEGMSVKEQTRTVATITLQNYFRMYDKISGMTGTAATEAVEFEKIYRMDVVEIPTNQSVIRKDEQDLIFATEKDKYQAICQEIARVHKAGQPMLVGTVSVERSEYLSTLLKTVGVRHQILNAKNHEREAYIIAEAGSDGMVTIATNMAGRGTDIKLGGNPEFRTQARLGDSGDSQEFSQLLEKEQNRWRASYEDIRQKGGLYVLGTERHESRRIDNQLRGRSGRQGDPGHSQFFISMDDDLMRLFGKSRQSIQSLMTRGMDGGSPLNHPLITRSISRAQKRVEERNFTIRKHLLEFDDVLNAQRNIIYQQRDAILSETNLMQRISNTIKDLVSDALTAYRRSGDPADWQTGTTELNDTLLSQIDISPSENPDEGIARIAELLRKELQEKEHSVGEDRWNLFIRMEYLKHIDRQWRNHLSTLEGLREAVYLRSYAQKNPLLEYKLEGFQTFDQMIARIRTSIVRTLFAVRITREVHQDALPQGLRSQHASVDQFSASNRHPTTVTRAPAKGGTTATLNRSVPKVGRNDPCPCGSGKKYKRCHGA